jgi:hypothetical protein
MPDTDEYIGNQKEGDFFALLVIKFNKYPVLLPLVKDIVKHNKKSTIKVKKDKKGRAVVTIPTFTFNDSEGLQGFEKDETGIMTFSTWKKKKKNYQERKDPLQEFIDQKKKKGKKRSNQKNNFYNGKGLFKIEEKGPDGSRENEKSQIPAFMRNDYEEKKSRNKKNFYIEEKGPDGSRENENKSSVTPKHPSSKKGFGSKKRKMKKQSFFGSFWRKAKEKLSDLKETVVEGFSFENFGSISRNPND